MKTRKTRKSLALFAFLALWVGGPSAAVADVPTDYGFYNNPVAQSVSEMGKYTLVLSAANMADNDANTGKLSWYDYADYNNSLFTNGYQRAAFYLELTNTSGATEWMLVTTPNYITSGDYKLSDLQNLGIPNPNADANGVINNYAIQKSITDMNVYYVKTGESAANMPILSNTATASDNGYSFVTGQTGIIEMWPSNYGGGKSGNLANITETGNYDWYDSGFGTTAGHGSYQIHLYDTTATAAPYGQTLFAINSATGGKQMGIGTNANGNPDWTFQTTAGVYSVKTLQIFAQPNYSTDSMIWENSSGNWSDITWKTTTGTALTTSPTVSNDVVILSGAISVPAASTASAKTLMVFGETAVDISGSMSVAEDVHMLSNSPVNLSGTLTTGSGGTIVALNTTGAGTVSNTSTSAALKIGNITGAAGSSLTLTGSQLTITGQTVSTPTLNISDGSTVTLAPTTSTTISSAITGTGALTQTARQVIIPGSITGYPGTYTVSAGALNAMTPDSKPSNLAVQSGGSLNLYTGTNGFSQAQYDEIAGGTQIAAGGYLGVYAPTNQALALTINKNVGFSKTGVGTLTVTGADNSDFASTTRVFEGRLQIGNATAAGTLGGAIIVDSGASTVFDVSAETNQTKVMKNYVSGAGNLIVRGGTLQFTSDTKTACTPYSSWTSASGTDTAVSLININTTIESGARVYFADTIVPAATQNMTWTVESGGVLEFNNTASGASHYAANSLTGDGTSSTDFSTRSAGGSITINGAGTLTKSGNGAFALLCQYKSETVTMSQSEGGWIDVQGGTFITGGWSGNIFWSANKGSVNLAAGTTLNLWDGNEITIDSLTGSGTITKGHLKVGIANNVASDQYGVANNTATFTGVFGNGNGHGLTKVGTGTQIMAGDNNYTGATNVSAGTLQFGNGGNTGKIGTGNVAVAAGANLVFNTTQDNTISGVLSGTGKVVQKGAGSTVSLTNAANTFTGTVDIQAGTLALGSEAGASNLGPGASVIIANGATLNYVTPAASTSDLSSVNISGAGTFSKSGAGTAIISPLMSTPTIALNGGTVSMFADMLNTKTVNVQSDSAISLAKSGAAQPWTVTMYRWADTKDANYANIAPDSTYTSVLAENWTAESGVNIRVYTGEAGWANWTADTSYNKTGVAVPQVWDMSGAGNNPNTTGFSTAVTRNWLSEYATLSYTTTIDVSKDLVLDFGGSFDDRCGAFARKLNADGSFDGDWITLSAFNWTSTGNSVSLPAGRYLLDVRVGDVGGGAFATAGIKSPEGESLGMGIRNSGGALTGTSGYYALDIDPQTGFLGLPDGSICSVSTYAVPLAITTSGLTVADGATLTIDNPNTESISVDLNGNIGGTGTVLLSNTAGTSIPFTFNGTTAGSITTASNIAFTMTENSEIAGDLTIGSNGTFEALGSIQIKGNLNAGSGANITLDKNVEIGGSFLSSGAIVNANQDDISGASALIGEGNTFDADDTTFNISFNDLAKPLGIIVDTTNLKDAVLNFTFSGIQPEADYTYWTFIDSNDTEASWLAESATDPTVMENTAKFSYVFENLPDMRAFARFNNGDYQLVIGNSASIPEPSTWAMLIIGLGGIAYLRRRKTIA